MKNFCFIHAWLSVNRSLLSSGDERCRYVIIIVVIREWWRVFSEGLSCVRRRLHRREQSKRGDGVNAAVWCHDVTSCTPASVTIIHSLIFWWNWKWAESECQRPLTLAALAPKDFWATLRVRSRYASLDGPGLGCSIGPQISVYFTHLITHNSLHYGCDIGEPLSNW